MPGPDISNDIVSRIHGSISYSKLVRDKIDKIVERSPNSNYDMTLSSAIHVISSHYTGNIEYPLIMIEHRLHDLWYIFIQAAKSISPLNSAQDTLIRHLMLAKALGPLPRAESTPSSNNASTKSITGLDSHVCFSDGSFLWSGLPLFALDLMEEFSSRRFYEETVYDEDKRKNLAAFIGRLLSVGMYNGSALCTLSLFRETLETPRPLIGDSRSEQALDTIRSMEDLLYPLHHLVIASEFSLAILSSNRPAAVGATASKIKPADYPHLSGLGELATQAGIPPSSTGYSPERWRFWIQRLEDLTHCGVLHVAGDATSCLTIMQTAQEDTMLL